MPPASTSGVGELTPRVETSSFHLRQDPMVGVYLTMFKAYTLSKRRDAHRHVIAIPDDLGRLYSGDTDSEGHTAASYVPCKGGISDKVRGPVGVSQLGSCVALR
jgi:hypothetical protein